MAGVIRFGFSRTFAATKKLVPEIHLVRCISGSALRITDPNVKKPAPWPYKEKPYRIYNRLFDKTTARFDENTKIIVVEGPIAAGKSAFAKTIAEDLGMLYMPEANSDMLYVNEYGYDLRDLDPYFPEATRSFDVNDFCKNPNHKKVAGFQFVQYMAKYSQYIDALAHLFSTGQGVVLDRCVYSDYVFLETMVKHGYVSKGARSLYHEVKENTIGELMRPHLVIYLDLPVNLVQQRIKERKIPYEINSKALTSEYLATMEQFYKQDYLKNIGKHAELLVYDWSQGGDVEVIVEDIERIDFDHFDKYDEKMEDWRLEMEEDWAVQRSLYADKKAELMQYMCVPRFDVPELIVEADDIKMTDDVIDERAKGFKYDVGYNTDMGDTGILFKTHMLNRHTLPLIERKIRN